jgi:predicted  nucleic acid-binding Zn-ribbon protein
LENCKAECARKDTEVYALRTQLDALQKQVEDHQQHIRVLREQIAAKDQQSHMLQTDVRFPVN